MTKSKANCLQQLQTRTQEITRKCCQLDTQIHNLQQEITRCNSDINDAFKIRNEKIARTAIKKRHSYEKQLHKIDQEQKSLLNQLAGLAHDLNQFTEIKTTLQPQFSM